MFCTDYEQVEQGEEKVELTFTELFPTRVLALPLTIVFGLMLYDVRELNEEERYLMFASARQKIALLCNFFFVFKIEFGRPT